MVDELTDYDIIVVGAGPIGSTYAYYMAKEGYSVALYDMKTRIGQPLQCAGLVSTNIDKTGNLPRDMIINEIEGAHLISPNKTEITVKKDKTVAYVLDRVYYDKYLFQRAIDAGADVFLGERVWDVDMDNTTIKTYEGKKSAKIIVVSCGPASNTAKEMNPDLDNDLYLALQYTVQTDNKELNYVNLELHEEVLPGFIWKIPTSPTQQRVGLFTNKPYKTAETILNQALNDGDIVLEKHTGTIPKYNKNKRIVKNNTILLGDSASQVKPTTGGGLIVGFTMAKIAAEKSALMLKENNNKYLMEYEEEYHKLYDKEFKSQLNVQDILEELLDEDFNQMFDVLKENNVDKIISQYGDMDTQTPLIKELLKNGIIFKLVPKIGVRRLKNIWKSL